MTVFALGETLAGIGERGAALMETVGVVVGGLEQTTMVSAFKAVCVVCGGRVCSYSWKGCPHTFSL